MYEHQNESVDAQTLYLKASIDPEFRHELVRDFHRALRWHGFHVQSEDQTQHLARELRKMGLKISWTVG